MKKDPEAPGRAASGAGGAGSVPEAISLPRRELLRSGAAGALMLTVLPAGCGGEGVSPPTGPVAAGNVSGTAVDMLAIVAGENVVLGRDAGGLYAMSAACTHAGCLISTLGSAAQGLDCACHGSRFDRNGAVTRGPASSPLQHYRVDVASDGGITIQGGFPVAADVRTAVA